jgi:hypothetical protein
MMWRRITAVAIGLCLGLGLWICLRDLNASAPDITDHARAVIDAQEVLDTIASAQTCGVNGCRAQVLGHVADRVWRLRLTTPSWRRCFLVNVGTFPYAEYGPGSVRAIPCSLPAAARIHTTRQRSE